MRQHLEVVAEALPLLRVKDDLLALEDFLRRNEMPLGVLSEEGFDHALIFAVENRAGRVDEAAARLHETARVFENRLLNRVDAVEFFRREAPLEVGIAAEGARPRAGGVDEHAVELPVQTADAVILFVADRDRVHVREPGAAHARRHAGEALFIHVEGVEAARRAHERPHGESLAARARAEVAHHFAAARLHKARDELAPFVLNVHLPILVDRPLREAGLRRQTNAFGAVGRGKGFDAVAGEFIEHFFARGLEKVHAKVEGRPFEHGRVERVRVVVLGFDEVVEPLRKFGAHVRRGLREVRFKDVLQGARFGTDRGFGNGVEPVLARKRHERRETRRTIRTHRAHRPANRRVVAKGVVDPFGDEAAVAHAELRIALEKELHQNVRRTVELQDHGERARQFVDDEARDAHAARSERGHALFRRLRPFDADVAAGVAFLTAALVGRDLAFRAAAFGLFRAARFLHRKGATLGEFGFGHRKSGKNGEFAGGGVVHDGAAVFLAHAAFEEGLHHGGIELVFENESAVGERVGRVGGQHRNDRLADDGAAVENRAHEVHGRAVHAAARFDRPFVGVKTREERQQGRVNVEHAPFEAREGKLKCRK